MMDDIAEQQELANEISNAISNPVAFGQDIDEDELEAELEQLEQEEFDQKLIGVPVGPSTDELPAVPTAEPVKPKQSESKSIRFMIVDNICVYKLFFLL